MEIFHANGCGKLFHNTALVWETQLKVIIIRASDYLNYFLFKNFFKNPKANEQCNIKYNKQFLLIIIISIPTLWMDQSESCIYWGEIHNSPRAEIYWWLLSRLDKPVTDYGMKFILINYSFFLFFKNRDGIENK